MVDVGAGALDVGTEEVELISTTGVEVAEAGCGVVDVGDGALDVGTEEVELISTTWPYIRREITR